MKVDWDHLQFFLVLARAKTLTNAARIIGVEHSTVSRRIQALELALGTPLFRREATGYELTMEVFAINPDFAQILNKNYVFRPSNSDKDEASSKSA